METYDCVIVGAGPAGAACALRLHQLAIPGWRILLVDKEQFPRSKVCGSCLNLAALDVLQKLACSERLMALNPVPLDRWEARYRGRHVAASLPGGYAVSRHALDNTLIEQVASTSIEVRTSVSARFLSQDSQGVTLALKADRTRGTLPPTESASNSDAETLVRSQAVVFATGLAGGGLDTVLPWKVRPYGPIGVGALLKGGPSDLAHGVIYMACSQHGYVGLVQIEDGQWDVAAALYPHVFTGQRQPLGQVVANILSEAGFTVPADTLDARWKGTPPLRRERVQGNGRVIAVGDAARYVEPFTGEGMAWGIRSGVIAAESLSLWARGEVKSKRLQQSVEGAEGRHASKKTRDPSLANRPPVTLGEFYETSYHELLSRRSIPCRLLTQSLRYRMGRGLIFAGLTRAPWLAKPVIHYMNRNF